MSNSNVENLLTWLGWPCHFNCVEPTSIQNTRLVFEQTKGYQGWQVFTSHLKRLGQQVAWRFGTIEEDSRSQRSETLLGVCYTHFSVQLYPKLDPTNTFFCFILVSVLEVSTPRQPADAVELSVCPRRKANKLNSLSFYDITIVVGIILIL